MPAALPGVGNSSMRDRCLAEHVPRVLGRMGDSVSTQRASAWPTRTGTRTHVALMGRSGSSRIFRVSARIFRLLVELDAVEIPVHAEVVLVDRLCGVGPSPTHRRRTPTGRSPRGRGAVPRRPVAVPARSPTESSSSSGWPQSRRARELDPRSPRVRRAEHRARVGKRRTCRRTVRLRPRQSAPALGSPPFRRRRGRGRDPQHPESPGSLPPPSGRRASSRRSRRREGAHVSVASLAKKSERHHADGTRRTYHGDAQLRVDHRLSVRKRREIPPKTLNRLTRKPHGWNL